MTDAPHAHGQINCGVCGNRIKTMTFKGSGVCGDICRKKRDEKKTKTSNSVKD